ncbi:MAG: discoidin domain-containing protein [Synergistaceae bacterium]
MSSASSSSSSSSSQDSSSSSSIDSSSSSSLGVSGYVPLVPKMTSNSLPSPYVASASSNKSGFSAEYYAFDRTINAWFSSDSSTPQWIKIYMGSGNPKLAQHYSVTAAANAPTDWTLEGSNDDVSWDILDTRSNQTGWSGETRYYSNIENTTEYTYYRLNISAYSGGPFMVVREFQLYSYPGASYSSQSSSSSTSYRRWPGPFDLPRIYILSKQDTGFTVKYENIPEEVGYVEFAYMAM